MARSRTSDPRHGFFRNNGLSPAYFSLFAICVLIAGRASNFHATLGIRIRESRLQDPDPGHQPSDWGNPQVTPGIGGDAAMKIVYKIRKGTIFSSFFSPMPLTRNKSRKSRKGPCSFRYCTMTCAVFSPIPRMAVRETGLA